MARPHTPSPASTTQATELERLRLLVLAAQRLGNRQLSEKLRPADLTPSQAEIVHVLGQRPGLTLSQLGGLIVCENGSPSRSVDILVRRGLVSRVQSPDDRRFIELGLTQEGHKLLPTVEAAFRSSEEEIAQRISPAEQGALISILSTLLDGAPAVDAINRRCEPHNSAPPLRDAVAGRTP